MEKRAILAAILMVGLLFLYQAFFAPVPPPPPPTEPVTEPQPPAVPSVATQPPLPARVSRPEPTAQRRVEVETPLYSGAVASDGGRLLEWVLHYRGEKPLVVPGIVEPSGLTVRRTGAEDQVLNFRQLSTTRIGLELPYQSRGQLRLAGEDGFGLAVSEELEFQADDYRVNVRIQVKNRHDVSQAAELLLGWTTPEKLTDGQRDTLERQFLALNPGARVAGGAGGAFQGQLPTGVSRLSNGRVQRADLEKVEDLTEEGKWIALESTYYIAALVSLTPEFTVAVSKGTDGTIQIALKGSPPPLAPGAVWEGRALFYIGPKEYDRLKALGVGLEAAVDFGGFPLPRKYGGLPMKWIAVPLLWLMNFFYRLIPNYGVAIILLTVIVKVLFYPLTLKSMTSMKKMQAIQPQVNALRAKYQKDPQRLQRETMALYKKHGVNPLGGCLPMVVQMPIFISLYWVFSLAVELQDAVFLCFGTLFGRELWICDLAEADPTYVLPVLMGASMFIQQKMTPMMGDPRQAKIMLMMPVMFTFFFLNLPSGLVLYWCVSNVLQILQQLYMNRPVRTTKELRQAG